MDFLLAEPETPTASYPYMAIQREESSTSTTLQEKADEYSLQPVIQLAPAQKASERFSLVIENNQLQAKLLTDVTNARPTYLWTTSTTHQQNDFTHTTQPTALSPQQ